MSVPAPVRANDGAALLGGLIMGGILGSQTQKQRTYRPRAVNQTVLADQNALNYFGYDAGPADGVMGSRTRSAISQYQAYMGYPVTGNLEEYQRQNLVGGHNWAQSGGNVIYPGIQGAELLRAYSSYSRGVNYCQETGRCLAAYPGQPVQPQTYATYPPNMGQVPPAPPVMMQPQGAPTVTRIVPPATTTPVVPPPTATPPAPSGDVMAAGLSIPSFDLPAQTETRSILGHCQTVESVASANGGPASSPAAITDAEQALDEQFCNATSFATDATASRLAGANIPEDTLAANCGQLRDFMAGLVETLGTGSAQDVTGAAQRLFAQASAQSGADGPIQAAEICVGYGYRTDDAQTAMAASLLLVGAGRLPYAELLGHHLRGGFGIAADETRARGWYDTALTALESGAEPVFMPGQSGQRVAIMRAALNANDSAPTAVALPTFTFQ